MPLKNDRRVGVPERRFRRPYEWPYRAENKGLLCGYERSTDECITHNCTTHDCAPKDRREIK